ncbi:hypothetical protein ABG79_01328 [Caloramator mitchellensis]|uniref:Stage III sporulation protein AG n=1 Tax=Caloramator mitchellensis TaxID=908809 RepID=A0A0R3K1K2_CALMK|nr:stage III sporulation protein AG [Caloramator mitchellensis]KRQ86837.1 hypothetical protein ABG79_01328 [Caloramator mitchellensis]
MDFKKFMDKLPKDTKKIVLNVLIVILVGILLMIIADTYNQIKISDKKKKEEKSVIEVSSEALNPTFSYEEKIKRELTEILSQIEGVGKVSVMIYFEGGSATVPAYNENYSTRKIEEKDNQGGNRITTENNKNINVVLLNEGNSNKPLIIKQINPNIGGVIVVAEGAKNPMVKEQIITAVKTLLNVPSYKVSALPMKN